MEVIYSDTDQDCCHVPVSVQSQNFLVEISNFRIFIVAGALYEKLTNN